MVYKEKSIRANYIYNVLYIASGMFFPLVTFPYAARVMQAEGIGEVSYYQSIINYVTILISLGIPLFGIREIAKKRNNKEDVTHIFAGILSLHLCLMVIAYSIIFLFLIFGNINNRELFLLMSTYILLYTLGCEWLYKGLEEFKYITLRTILIRLLSVIFLFVFVRKREDIVCYAISVLITTAGGYIFNIIRLREYISWKSINFSIIHPLKQFGNVSKCFVIHIFLSAFPTLGISILGLIGTHQEVGLYTGAVKFVLFLASFISAVSNVLLPRLSKYHIDGRKDDFDRLCQKSINYVFIICPLICGILMVVSRELIILFCGGSFEPAFITLIFLSPLIVTSPLIKIIVMDILFPQNKEKLVASVLALSLITEVLLCCVLYGIIGYNCLAVAAISSNLLALFIFMVFAKSYIPYQFGKKHIYYICSSALVIFVVLIMHYILEMHPLFKVLAIGITGLLIYMMILEYSRDKNYIEMKKDIMGIITRFKN